MLDGIWLRATACLVTLNRCVNVFVYMWKFYEVRRAAWNMLKCQPANRDDIEPVEVHLVRFRSGDNVVLIE